MLPIAGQTAGPIGLNFFVDTHGWSTCAVDLKKITIFLIHGQRRALQLVINNNPENRYGFRFKGIVVNLEILSTVPLPLKFCLQFLYL